jgi:3-hydroxyacyl-CoA dehydrogenase/enoyl-CoA hydratase/3-hydroxybutyryl-CoA epimerase
MGGDIAAWAAFRGFDVTLQDREMKFIEPALKRADALYEKKIKDPTKRAETRARLKADVDGSGVAKADLVIEAIFENADAKQALFKKAEESLKSGAILATNTSSIALEILRDGRSDASRFAGLHFFNPVAMMPLVEIVQHDGLDAETTRRLAAFCKAIDKLPVARLWMDAPGESTPLTFTAPAMLPVPRSKRRRPCWRAARCSWAMIRG